VGGLFSSTLLSLFLVPSMFTLLAKPAVKNPEDAVLDDPLVGAAGPALASDH
jgi:hypothetical protein